MSGIFGVVSNSKIITEKYDGLLIWNESYGDIDRQIITSEKVMLGIKPEKLSTGNEETKTYINRESSVVGVIDSLVFAGKEQECSDEQFIFDRIVHDGVNAISNINGDFAGAIWNEKSQELILFRDHCGVRPLFYYMDNSRVIFSSDIRGIISIEDVNTEINEDWIYKSLEGFSNITISETEYKNIFMVPFGGYIIFTFGDNGISVRSGNYWVPGEKKIRYKNREAYTKELRKLVEDAVRIRAKVSDLPKGSELSGGLDSGVVSLLLSEIDKDCYYFSWTPGKEDLEYAKGDERYVIDDICEHAGIKCDHGKLSIDFSKSGRMRERFPIKDRFYDDLPFTLNYAFPNYLNTPDIFETADYLRQKGVKFIFTGHGGDEGISHRGNTYELFHNHEYYRYLRLMYSRTSRDRHRIISTVKLIKQNFKHAHDEFKAPYIYRNKYGNRIVKKDFAEKYRYEDMPRLSFFYDPKSYVRSGGSKNRLDVLAFYSACAGVRYLAPFMDYRVIDFALGIPRYLYFNWFWDRYIYREAFKDIMPKSLYKQVNKESNSFNNIKSNDEVPEVSEEEIINAKEKYLSLLDRNYWDKYLDYDYLDEWRKKGVRTEEDRMIMDSLLTCIQADFLVKRSREIKNI